MALAVREKNSWRYIGHVGTGFSQAAKSPFPVKVKELGQAKLVAEIKFTEWTSSGETRHPVKRAADVVREEKPSGK